MDLTVPDPSHVDLRVLGQLLLMQSVVTSLPDDAIFPFVIKGLSDIPGVASVDISTEESKLGEPESSPRRFPLISNKCFHGEIHVTIAEMELFAPFVDHIRNFAFMLAIILEERRQRRLIDEHQRDLEQQVAHRNSELAQERDTVQSYLDIAAVMLLALDHNGSIKMINKQGARLLGKPVADLLGLDWFDHFIPVDQQDTIRKFFHKLIQGTSPIAEQYENDIVTASGQKLTMAWNNALMRDATGKIVGTLSSAEDITARRIAENRIRTLAYYDQLTGLPNRTLFLERLRLTMAEAQHSHSAVILIDLDNFKSLNDTHGHDVGDLLLMQVSTRLSASVRCDDIVARLGGDEFGVILNNRSLSDEESVRVTGMVAGKVLSTLNQVYHLGDVVQISTPSIGATTFIGQSLSAEVVMKQAELAMYHSKAAGRNTVRFFDANLEKVVLERTALESDLRQALDRHEFELYYQAQVAGENRLTGAEVLVRWHHPERGLVSPAQFIPLAEETGLILSVGRWVLETACNQLALWSGQSHLAPLVIAVNVSAHQFRQPDFVNQVLSIVSATGADPRRLKLELTESLLVENIEDIVEKMYRLKAKGVGFSLDDFGTGYSSLSYLKRLPLDQLKIDQSFVRDILIDPNDATIAKTIVTLAQSLGLGVIAEGVETAEQWDFLTVSGCHACQGYFFSRPLPLAEFERYAARQISEASLD